MLQKEKKNEIILLKSQNNYYYLKIKNIFKNFMDRVITNAFHTD